MSLEAPTSGESVTPSSDLPAAATILIVDDDLPMRTLLERCLTLFGYRALVAGNGEEGLQSARTHPEIDLIMLDVVMSGISGQKLAEQLTILLPNAAILFCSGHSAQALVRQGIQMQGAQFMQKPYRPPELKQRISEMLAAR
jgi:two-component system, cell cycle sensor histidine kinase and response regulator CckA